MRISIWIKIAISLIVIVITSAIGMWISSEITPDAHSEAQKIHWSSLGSPPEPAEKINGVFLCEQSYGVIIESTSGAGYIACPSGWQTWNNPITAPMPLDKCSGDPPTQYSPGFKDLPLPVKDCAFRFQNEWAIVENVYVILDNGSVWQWNFTYGIGNALIYLVGGLFWGLIVGIVISIVFWRLVRQRNR
jgi:hypothetical protein